jgi:hypothetical protein
VSGVPGVESSLSIKMLGIVLAGGLVIVIFLAQETGVFVCPSMKHPIL